MTDDNPTTTTPGRSFPTEPAGRPSIRTPGIQRVRRTPGSQRSVGSRGPAANAIATPHRRAAQRALDSRRSIRRRSSVGTRPDPILDILRPLAKRLAPDSQPIASSSSSPHESVHETTGDATTLGLEVTDSDEDLPRRPRLSLPIDEDDDDDNELSRIRPHRSVGLEDDNFTVQSIEMPRRAVPDQSGSRFSLGSVRMSDYFNNRMEVRSPEATIDSGFFPTLHPSGEDNSTSTHRNITTYDRDDDSDRAYSYGEPDLGGESDFHIDVPVDVGEGTLIIAPQIQDSPVRQEMTEQEPIVGADDLGTQRESTELAGASNEDGLYDVAERVETNEPIDESDDARTQRDMTTTRSVAPSSHKVDKPRRKVSKYGMEYPSLPSAVVKNLAQRFAETSGAKGKISPEALKAIIQASDWFFEQLGDDLGAYAKHAHRSTINESDMLTLMKRQRQTSAVTTPFSLAQKYLPRELLQELRMPPPQTVKQRPKTARGARTEEEEST